jgi:hypothetical protein
MLDTDAMKRDDLGIRVAACRVCRSISFMPPAQEHPWIELEEAGVRLSSPLQKKADLGKENLKI